MAGVLWTNVAVFTNSWVSGDAANPARFIRDGEGVVHLAGTINGGTVADGPTGAAFTLPSGFRPDTGQTLFFEILSSPGAGTVKILGTGEVRATNGSNALVALDGITFYAEQ